MLRESSTSQNSDFIPLLLEYSAEFSFYDSEGLFLLVAFFDKSFVFVHEGGDRVLQVRTILTKVQLSISSLRHELEHGKTPVKALKYTDVIALLFLVVVIEVISACRADECMRREYFHDVVADRLTLELGIEQSVRAHVLSH